MPLLIVYMLKFSISLALVYLFYRTLLRRLTFYNYNRWYLVGYSLLCFLIPFINISSFVDNGHHTGKSIVGFIPAIESYTGNAVNQRGNVSLPTATSWDRWDVMLLLMATGAGILLVRFFIQLLSFLKLKRKAQLIPTGDMRLYHVDESIIPFSFGNSVFINSRLHSGDELQEIVRHEFVHVKQRHTIDIIWGELICMVNWFNPFAWLLKAAIRQNLEFIADNKVVKMGVDKKQYQYLLLKVIGNNQYSIAPKFNFSSLKKRIAMMNKLRTARVHMIKFLFVLPLLTVLLISFRNTGKNARDRSKPIVSINDTTDPQQLQRQLEEITAFFEKHPEIGKLYATEDKTRQIVFLRDGNVEKYGYPGTPSTEQLEQKYGTLPSLFKKNSTDHSAYYEQWSNISAEASRQFTSESEKVKQIIFPGDSRVLVQLKNNNVEIYDMDYDKDRGQFESEFGKLPDCVPPAARRDDIPAEERTMINRDTVPGHANEKGYIVYVSGSKNNAAVVVKDKAGKLIERIPYEKWQENEKSYVDKYGDFDAPPVPPAPPAPPLPPAPPQPIDLPANVKKIDVRDKKATVVLKDGGEEKYDLNKPEEKAKFEKKYGDIIPPPPPPPPAPSNHEISAVQEVSRSICDNMEITETKAVMHIRNGSVEEYDLTKASDKQKFETKYGKIVSVAPAREGVVEVSESSAAVVEAPEAVTAVSPETRARVAVVDDNGNVMGGEEKVLVVISRKSTPQQLDELVTQMRQRNIDLKFTRTEYKNGILMRVEGTMKHLNGEGNFSATDFNKVTLSEIKDGEGVHLMIRIEDHKKVTI